MLCLVCRDHKPVFAHVHPPRALCCGLSHIWITRLPGAETTFQGCAWHSGAVVGIGSYNNNREYNDAKLSWHRQDKQKKNGTKGLCAASGKKWGYFISTSVQICTCGLCSCPSLQKSFSFWEFPQMDNIHFYKDEFTAKQWGSDNQRNLGCGLGRMCEASLSLELRFILEGTKKPHDLCLQEALFLVLKDLIQVWVMFSRQSGDIPGDSICDISAHLILGLCVQQTGSIL